MLEPLPANDSLVIPTPEPAPPPPVPQYITVPFDVSTWPFEPNAPLAIIFVAVTAIELTVVLTVLLPTVSRVVALLNLKLELAPREPLLLN